VAESDKDAHDRAYAEGELAERLANYDRHFERINGSIEKGANAQADLAKPVPLFAPPGPTSGRKPRRSNAGQASHGS